MTRADTHQKALALNLDPTSFGSFAEIGAGQEVARWFLRVGGASGTVAKTVSAYDKEVSDDLYGSGTRYVSKPRLQAMLDREWKSLVQQVGEARGSKTRLFAFADTIAARNFAGTNDCHGWIGVRFQDRPQAAPSEILLHVNLRDKANVLQQEAVGIVGVNLLHALLSERAPASAVPARLFDNLANDRVEVDQVDMSGSVFAGCDLKALHIALARDGHAEAVTLSSDGAAIAANESLYKKAVVITPAPGDSADEPSRKAISACVQALRKEVAGDAEVKDVIDVSLVALKPDSPLPDAAGFSNRMALITRHQPLYRISSFVRRYTQAPLRFAVMLPTLMRIFDAVRYQDLEGRMLEGVARLVGHDVRVVAYPSLREDIERLRSTEAGSGWDIDGSGPWITADQLRPVPPLRHLYEYLLATGFLVAMSPEVRT